MVSKLSSLLLIYVVLRNGKQVILLLRQVYENSTFFHWAAPVVNKYVNYDHLGESSPEKDCLGWL